MIAEKKIEHLDYIDVSKGIAIILVILGHTIRDDMIANQPGVGALKEIIYSFQVPLFLFLSGLMVTWSNGMFRYRSSFVRKKVKSLLIPFICYSLFLFAIFKCAWRIPLIAQILVNAGFEKKSLISYLYLIFVVNNPYSQHLWYLWILFLYHILTWTIAHIILKKTTSKYKSIVILLVALLLEIIYFLGPDILMKYYMLLYFTKNYIFYVLGTIVSRSIRRFFKPMMGIIGIICFFLVSACRIFLPISTDVCFVPVKLMITASTCAVLVAIVYWSFLMSGNIARLLKLLGKKTFVVYLLHQPYCAFIGVLLYSCAGFSAVFTMICCAGFSLIFPILVEYCADKNKHVKHVCRCLLNICT